MRYVRRHAKLDEKIKRHAIITSYLMIIQSHRNIDGRYTTPYLKTFFTDLGANIINMQSGPCMDFEINVGSSPIMNENTIDLIDSPFASFQALECIEYYGAKQGLTACKDW